MTIMGKRFSSILLEFILMVGILSAVSQLAVIHSGSRQTIPATNAPLPKLARQMPYEDSWTSLERWLRWLVSNVSPGLEHEWGSFTAGEIFETIPTVEAATITRVQGSYKGTWSSGTTISVALLTAPTNGNVVILTAALRSGSSGQSVISSIAETGVNWSSGGAGKQVGLLANFASGSHYEDGEIWLGLVGSGASTSITVTLSAVPNAGGYSFPGGVVDVCEYSGIATTSFLDKTATSSNAGSTTTAPSSTGTTATTSQANELLIGESAVMSYSQSSPTNGFALLDGAIPYQGTGTSNAYLEKIVSSTGAYGSGATFTSSFWVGCIATFEAPTGPPPADFSITANPSSQSIGAGATASSTLSIAAGGGFTGTVSLSYTSGCPSGVTCTVSPTSISSPYSTTSTLTVPTLITTSGTFPVVVSATSGSLTHTATFTVTVTTSPSFNFNVKSTSTQVIVTVLWTGTGTASVTIAGPDGSPTMLESGAVIYDRTSYVSGTAPPTNIHRVTFTLSSPPAGTWTAYVSQSGATVTIEVS